MKIRAGKEGKRKDDRGQREEGGGRDPYGFLEPEAAVRFHSPCLTFTYHLERACCGVLAWDAPMGCSRLEDWTATVTHA